MAWFVFRPHGCPCGYATDPRRDCRCTPRKIENYLSRISGPLLDRIDIHLDVPAVPYRELKRAADGDDSASMRERVMAARRRQYERLRGLGARKVHTNAQMSNRYIKKTCKLRSDAESLLGQAMQELALSARAYTKILKVARTIADLAGAEDIRVEDVSEAIQYRSLDRNLWV